MFGIVSAAEGPNPVQAAITIGKQQTIIKDSNNKQ